MKCYHICLSGNEEIMFRTHEDYCRGINCMLIAAYRTKSVILAYAFMSTHIHVCVRTDQPYKLITRYRYAYTRYFNSKYFRKGKLGNISPYIVELDGLYHTIAAISYVLRNPLHHGVCETAFAYPYSSIHSYFKKSMGAMMINPNIDNILPRHKQYHYLPSRANLPDTYTMSLTGILNSDKTVDYADVEHLYVSARSFCYYMNRISGESWIQEQQKDQNGKEAISLELIEKGVSSHSINDMLKYEHGRFDCSKLSDMELCTIIDCEYIDRGKGDSVYTIEKGRKENILGQLKTRFRNSTKQLRRCLHF